MKFTIQFTICTEYWLSQLLIMDKRIILYYRISLCFTYFYIQSFFYFYFFILFIHILQFHVKQESYIFISQIIISDLYINRYRFYILILFGMSIKDPPYRYQTQFISLASLSKILYTLRKQKINRVKISIACPDKSIIAHLEKNLFSPISQVKRSTYLHKNTLSKQDVPIELVKCMKYKKVIDLCSQLLSRIFVHEYSKKLRELGEEFNIYLIWEGTIIKVYSDSPISSVFESQIIGMKQKLKWIIYQNEKLYAKLKISRFIASKFHEMKIKFLFFTDNKTLVLQSSQVSPAMITAAANSFDYDAIILHFSNSSFSKMVNRTYFKLLMFQMGNKLEQIEDNYEIKCQVNEKRMGLIMHTRDPIFSKEPTQELNNLMSKIIFITYYTQNPGQHLFHIRNSRPKSKCLKVMMSQTYIYTSWNFSNQIEPLEVTKVYEKLLSQININSIIRIIFKYGELNEALIRNVEELAQKYKFHSFPPQFQTEREEIIHIKFKSFNPQRRKDKILQLSCFLQELITKKTSQSITVPFETHQQENSVVQNDQDKEEAVLQISLSNLQTSKYLQYKYQAPTVKRSQTFSINCGKRNKELEDYFLQNLGIVCRIWNLIIDMDVEQFYKPVQGEMSQICITETIQRESGIKIKKPEELDISKIKNECEYYLVYKSIRSLEYVLGYKMKVYIQ